MKIARTVAFYFGLAVMLAAIAAILWAIFYPCAGMSECLGETASIGLFAIVPLVFGIVLVAASKLPSHISN